MTFRASGAEVKWSERLSMSRKKLPIPADLKLTFQQIVEQAKQDIGIDNSPGLSMWYVRQLAAGDHPNRRTLGMIVARSKVHLPHSIYMYVGALESGEIKPPRGASKLDPFEAWSRQNLVVAMYEEIVHERHIPSRMERRSRTAYDWVVAEIARECNEKAGTVRDMLEGKSRWPKPNLTPMPKRGG